jgi:hypothetical protein
MAPKKSYVAFKISLVQNYYERTPIEESYSFPPWESITNLEFSCNKMS